MKQLNLTGYLLKLPIEVDTSRLPCEKVKGLLEQLWSNFNLPGICVREDPTDPKWLIAFIYPDQKDNKIIKLFEHMFKKGYDKILGIQ